MRRKKLLYIIIALVVIKIAVTYFGTDQLTLSGDESRNFRIAANYRRGLGYTVFDEKTKSYQQSAFHGSFPVFTYIFLQKINVSEDAWKLILYSISVVFYALSLLYFYRLLRLFSSNETRCLITTVLYGLYPSVIYYIGALAFYENIAMPILIIIIYKLILYSSGRPVKKYDLVTVPVLITLSCLYRTHMIPIYAGILFIFFIITAVNYFKNNHRVMKQAWILVLTVTMLALAHIPILKKNHAMFGSYIISTQSGFELLRGHNPLARGSYWGTDADEAFNEYIRGEVPDMFELNEYEQSAARRKMAIRWILNNPLGELKLMARKIAIYFLPQNYAFGLRGDRLYNPVNLAVHLLFLLSCMLTLIRLPSRGITKEEILLLSPVVFSILLTLVFFVGYRWRYYAEPFMIIYAFLFIQRLTDERKT